MFVLPFYNMIWLISVLQYKLYAIPRLKFSAGVYVHIFSNIFLRHFMLFLIIMFPMIIYTWWIVDNKVIYVFKLLYVLPCTHLLCKMCKQYYCQKKHAYISLTVSVISPLKYSISSKANVSASLCIHTCYPSKLTLQFEQKTHSIQVIVYYKNVKMML